MSHKEKADSLYTDAYMRWCYEPSEDKNNLMAKSIAHYVCDEVLSVIWDKPDDVTYWKQVKQEIQNI